MNTRKLIALSLCLGLSLAWASASNLLALQNKQKKQQVIYIPKPVKTVIQEGIETRETRQDFPFALLHHFYFPAQQNIHNVFIFQVKNSDLGFVPADAPDKSQIKKEEAVTDQESPAAQTAELKAECHIFLQFNGLENGVPADLVKEVYIPFNLEAEEASYDPEREEIYSTGYPLEPGDYLLSMAIASKNLERIGTTYLELSLPSPFGAAEELKTTPLFFVKNLTQVPNPETRAMAHKGFFAYSILQIEPNLERVFFPTDNLDIFFFIIGAQPNDQNQYDIEISYEILQGEEPFVRYQPTKYNSPLISQPLPLKRTVLIKSAQEEKRESKNLEPGTYTLSISIKDEISGKILQKTMDFEVKT
jgi:hypothetical protein